MITHAGPSQAVSLAQQHATKLQLDESLSADEFLRDFMSQIEPVLTLEGVNRLEYLSEVRRHLKMEAEHTIDPRRTAFLRSVVDAISRRSETL